MRLTINTSETQKMTLNSSLKVLRLIPRDTDFLDRKFGARGEVFYDQGTNTLRLYDGVIQGGFEVPKVDLSNVTNAAFLAKAQAAGVGTGGGGNTTVTVSASTPTTPVSGNLWLNTNNGRLYVYVNDGTSSQWIQPATPLPVLTGYATETYVDNSISNAISAIPPVDLSTYATQSYVNQQIAMIPPAFDFSIAGDDSAQRKITTGNTVKFTGAGGITVATNADGVVTITGTPPSSVGNLAIVGTNIDSQDSSGISFTPSVTFNSDVNVENDLVVRNEVTAKIVYAEEFNSTSLGVPTLFSETALNLSATTAVIINRSPLRFASFTTAQRDQLAAINGDVIYNTTTNKFQGYANNTWVDLH